ncbi:hypothetical protein J0A68_10435 [Algoriphagus sp. H41]|uniref:Uncharacterized protein n=1 Tax=Algoriphagus oliviformis TaxID=2811231 RepID=A0ABS3C448_9BACT|nr:hypothetical protein [Algoriphagus oliviformis]MBN7811376.1 hypothetical protein [Algoriphagus oliviformis]
MKKLPEHSPKEGTWENILRQGDFDLQCRSLLGNLPDYAPRADAWAELEKKLSKREKPVFFVYWKTAAAISLVLAAMAWLLLDSQKMPKSQSTGPVLSHGAPEQLSVPAEKPLERAEPIESSSTPALLSAEAEIPKVNPRPADQAEEKTDPRPEHTPVELPERDLPSPSLAMAEPTIESLPLETRDTRHEVRISWGMQPEKPKPRATFGIGRPETTQETQVSRLDKPPGTIRIKFKN